MMCIGNRVNVAFIFDNFNNVLWAVMIVILSNKFVKIAGSMVHGLWHSINYVIKSIVFMKCININTYWQYYNVSWLCTQQMLAVLQ